MPELNVKKYILEPPLTDADVEKLRIGDLVTLNGTIYTARDAAHQRLAELILKQQALPFALAGQVLFYVGPSPAPPGRQIGSAGPTTSYRMDRFTPLLLKHGIKATVGKGPRGNRVVTALEKYKAVYFAAVGGAGALLATCVETCEVIAFPELGAEAIHRLTVRDFPVVVINDSLGEDLYEVGIQKWQRAAIARWLGKSEEE